MPLLPIFHWLPNSFEVKAKVFAVGEMFFFMIWHLVTSLHSQILVLILDSSPCCANTGPLALHQTPVIFLFGTFVPDFFPPNIHFLKYWDVCLLSPSGFFFNGTLAKSFLSLSYSHMYIYLDSLYLVSVIFFFLCNFLFSNIIGVISFFSSRI